MLDWATANRIITGDMQMARLKINVITMRAPKVWWTPRNTVHCLSGEVEPQTTSDTCLSFEFRIHSIRNKNEQSFIFIRSGIFYLFNENSATIRWENTKRFLFVEWFPLCSFWWIVQNVWILQWWGKLFARSKILNQTCDLIAVQHC